jgi:pimeloyl-ACP methyl ester carboxylesterase
VSIEVRSRHVRVDGLRTHYLEAGEGPTVVLLHAGGFGENGWLSWRRNLDALAGGNRVVAPDWLGFGKSDKVRDFVKGNQKMVEHMARFFEVMCIDDADVMGLSMGGTFLVKLAATDRPVLPLRTMVLVSGGGFSPNNDARKTLQGYDGSFEAMRANLSVIFADPSFAADDDLVAEYHEASREPGAWEFAASARLRAPFAPERSDFGNVDDTPYEKIAVPTLVTAGAQDQLRQPGYAEEIAARIPAAEVEVFDPCGHCPNVEQPDAWNARVLDFLDRRRPTGA